MQVRANAESIAFYRSGSLEERKSNSKLQVDDSHCLLYFILFTTIYIRKKLQ